MKKKHETWATVDLGYKSFKDAKKAAQTHANLLAVQIQMLKKGKDGKKKTKKGNG
jgi:hypothetical protein